ncbi:hypothetical protein HYFRA_00003918 [Hymenoscyphus fraxineus]|uniref:VOC domain-containing protein n=1 Tax=Hymenoscyphus fraxineus TaxID=746836 RepID=A0A9N9KYU9_9HELO|nr:hypothetical protein HYFRA_00003918 [Hymenoscyphus fraxineus]
MPLDHFCITVPQGKLEDIAKFLTTALASTGFKEIMRFGPNVIGFGEDKPYFWISTSEAEGQEESSMGLLKKIHIAFTAENAEQVRQFHAAALEAGASCNGPPGLRQYHPGYYAAFVHDPVLGINFEVVCHSGDS